MKLKKEKSFALFLTIIFITVFFSIFSYTLYLIDKNKSEKSITFVEKNIIISDIEKILSNLSEDEIDLVLKNNNNKFQGIIQQEDKYDIFFEIGYKKELLNINLIEFDKDNKEIDLFNRILFFENVEKPDIIANLLKERFLYVKNYYMNKKEFEEILFEYFLITNDFNVFKINIDDYFTFDNILINFKSISNKLLYMVFYPTLSENQVEEYILTKKDFEDFSEFEMATLNENNIYFDKRRIFCNIHISEIKDDNKNIEKINMIYNLKDKKVEYIE